MSTYNGEKYLRTQIDSVLAQEGVEVSLLVRDDGSTDSTKEILREYREKGLLEWYDGPNLRSAQSFMNLLRKAEDAPFYALCDQDDFWIPEKLRVAVEKLKEYPENEPAMYYGATTLTDGDLKPLEHQNTVIPTLNVAQAIIFPFATGCTMVMNRALVQLVNSQPCETRNMHDYWIHKVCLVIGGHCVCDPEPHILYRQHGNNVLGGSQSMMLRLKRHWNTMHKDPNIRSDEVVRILKYFGDRIPEENLEVCREVAEYRQSLTKRIKLAFDKRVACGDKRLDLLFRVAVLLGVL